MVSLLLLYCVGSTDDATEISSTGATLRATGTCASGDCNYYFRIWPVEVGPAVASATPQRDPTGMPPDTTAPIAEAVTGLRPDTRYRFQACGKEAHEASFLCANTREFTTAPPPEIPVFTAELTPPNVVTLRWSTTGGDTSKRVHIYGPWYDPSSGVYYTNVGYRSEHQNSEGLSFRVDPGHHRFVLALPTATGEVTRAVEITVPGLLAPNLPAQRLFLYEPLLADTRIDWTLPGPLPDPVEVWISPPGAAPIPAEQDTWHEFAKADLEALGLGEHRFHLRTCLPKETSVEPKMNAPFCGDSAALTLQIGAAQLQGPWRVHVPTGGDATVSWTPTGQYALLDAPLLGKWGQRVDGTSLELENLPLVPAFPAPQANDFQTAYTVEVTSCTDTPRTCALLELVTAGVEGTLEYLAKPPPFGQLAVTTQPPNGPTVLARIRKTADQSLVEVVTPIDGTARYIADLEPPDPVSADTLLHSIQPPGVRHLFDRMQLVVSDTPFQRKHWTEDFADLYSPRHVLPNYNHFLPGFTMPVLASADGNVWTGAEFSQGALVHIAGNLASGFVLTPFVAPLLQKPDPANAPQRLRDVRPFGYFHSTRKRPMTKQETVIEAGRYIWTINGGRQLHQASKPDYSRILRFDRQGVDLHTTPHDDRFCVYHVPFEGALVLGIAWDEAAGRIWYVEGRKQRGLDPFPTSVLGWFDPDELQCENDLDYENPAAVAAASTRYCTSPAETGCIHSVPLVDWEDPNEALALAAHVAVDPEAVWVAGFFSANLARYDRAAGRVDVLPVPGSSGLSKGVGAGPWKVVSHEDYVYFTEFFDGDVVRVDKQLVATDLASCKQLVGIRNPCMSEILASFQLKDLAVHGDRVYFAGSQEFGYVNRTAWTPGVLYHGLETLRNVERGKRGELISGDMAVAPDGDVVLNDYFAGAFYRLQPK
jgi:hypothetical protein